VMVRVLSFGVILSLMEYACGLDLGEFFNYVLILVLL